MESGFYNRLRPWMLAEFGCLIGGFALIAFMLQIYRFLRLEKGFRSCNYFYWIWESAFTSFIVEEPCDTKSSATIYISEMPLKLEALRWKTGSIGLFS